MTFRRFATRRSFESTARMLFTYFGEYSASFTFSAWTSTSLISSRRFEPSSGTRWTRRMLSFAYTVLAF